jgi:hypothetical protein
VKQNVLASLVAIVIGSASVPGYSKPATTTIAGRSTVAVTFVANPKDGETSVHKVNQTYEVVGSSTVGSLLLLDQLIETERTAASGYSLARITVKASTISATGTKVVFTIKDRGSTTSRSADDRLLLASDLGCCGANDTHVAYSLENGKRLFFTGGQSSPEVLTLDYMRDRYYVGVHTSGSHRDSDVYGQLIAPREKAMLITVASPIKIRDVVLLTFDSAKQEHLKSPSVRWTQAGDNPHWLQVAGDQPATLEVSVSSSIVVQIPIKGGQFMVDATKMPVGCHVRRVDQKELP